MRRDGVWIERADKHQIGRYHYPGVTNNVTVSLETYAMLAQHPNIVGCKMCEPFLPKTPPNL
jgi:dihydrodipicolinate synthase/N-acetylneuraminate lyase